MGRHGVATPALGAGHFAADELEALGSKAHHDPLARGDRLALWGDARADTALVGAHGEVGIARFGRELLDRPLDVDLTLELVPEEADGYVRIGCDLLPLATLIARIEDEASIFDLLE